MIPEGGIEGEVDRKAEFRRYLDTCYGDMPGALHIGVGYEPFFNADGKYGHKKFVPAAVRWPDEADDAIDRLLDESQKADVWVCPNPMVLEQIEGGGDGSKRAKGQAASRLNVHSDIDGEPFESAKKEKLAAIWFAAQFSTGTLEGCWKGRPQKVAYISSEESREYVVKPGLQVIGANMDNIVFPKVEIKGEAVSLSSDADEHKLARLLLDEGVTVVIVDPIMSTINRKVDIYRNNELREALAPWVRIAQRINGIVIGVVHLVKGTTGDVVGSVNGSSAFGEVARCVFGFAKDPEHNTERVMSQFKNSCGPEDLSLTYEIEETMFTADTGRKGWMSVFKLGDESDISVGEILDAGRGKKRPSPEMQRVIDFVNGRTETTTAADVYNAGLANSQKVASNTLERACKRGYIVKTDRGVFANSSVSAKSSRVTDELMKR
ncbi:MAG: hypothetical protein QOJ44_1790 [Acidimicrobiaceae bacterium]|jgi:hypothetical protein|nr:hypothetical protein [Acidimicrobiaceae bacterium]